MIGAVEEGAFNSRTLTLDDYMKVPLRFRASGRLRLQKAANVAHRTYIGYHRSVDDLDELERIYRGKAAGNVGGKKAGFFSSILASILISLAVRFGIWLIRKWWENRTTNPLPTAPIIEKW